MALVGKPILRLLRLSFLCLTSGLCCFFFTSLFYKSSSYYHVAQIRWPHDPKDQIAIKSLALAPSNKVDYAALLSEDDQVKNLWLLMKKKDCRLLGIIADKFRSLEIKSTKLVEEKAKVIFPSLSCPSLSLPPNLIDHQLTFGFLKPDLVSRGLAMDALRRIEEKDLLVHAVAEVQLSEEQASEFYAEHRGRPFFGELIEYMTSGPSIALIMSGRNGVKRWRDLMGPTDPAKAKKSAPRSLRAVYGLGTTKNSCHGSDSWVSASREISFACTHFHMKPHKQL